MLYQPSDTTNTNNEILKICVDMMTRCHLPVDIFSEILPISPLSNPSLTKHGCHVVLKPCNTPSSNDKETPCRYFTKWQILLLFKILRVFEKIPARERQMIDQWIGCNYRHSIEVSQIRSNIFDENSLATFNVQGNVFLEIVSEMESVLKAQKSLKWVPFQMKCQVLIDVFKVSISKLIQKAFTFIPGFLRLSKK
ncbi:unnamed protein product [Mytilus edulis]|uniref:Uncharacterized protein n=1 Tax=Mytilus edulis TaxID=6550 RepID=A0A8S3TCG9_MYTED|nr:unnamed protein product [Mytilus edulis]